jgi:hypothetical protein
MTKPDEVIVHSGTGLIGITKRELMATMILAGIAAKEYISSGDAQHAVKMADVLIAELNQKYE